MSRSTVGVTRIAILDPQAVFRRGLDAVLDGTSCEVVWEGHRCDLLVSELAGVDIVLLDRSYTLSRRDLVRQLLDQAPEVKIAVLSESRQAEHVSEALRAGAVAYIPKSIRASELLYALDVIGAGRSYVSPILGAALLGARPPARALRAGMAGAERAMASGSYGRFQ